ncbi:sulfite exporter TauE/SafE family protein, partial [Haloplanus ruber]
STVLIFGAALLVSSAVVLAAICRLRNDETGMWCRLTTS